MDIEEEITVAYLLIKKIRKRREKQKTKGDQFRMIFQRRGEAGHVNICKCKNFFKFSLK